MPPPDITTSSQPWLTIVGIGEDGWEGLTTAAKQSIESAAILYGGTRHLAFIPEVAATRSPWPSPMGSAIWDILTKERGRMGVVVLASGDPMLHGVGVRLTRELPRNEYRVIPQVSAFSLACARMGWPAVETPLVSLLNRAVEEINSHLRPGQRLVIYSEDGTTPAAVAHMLVNNGYGGSRFDVFESLGGPAEKHLEAEARTWSQDRCGDLNAIAVHCVADAGTCAFPLVPGLPEDAFDTDGQLTKREVRAVTLARLAPLPGQHLWDVGAGTGTIGIEWMRSHPSCTCVAFEAREDRVQRIAVNAKKLGTPGLRIILGEAPESFGGNRPPDAIFIGGGLGNENLFESCWTALRGGGHLVANAVTVASEARLIALQQQFGGDLVRIEIARAEPIGSELGWRPLMPIIQWTVVKPTTEPYAIGFGCSSSATLDDVIGLIESCVTDIVAASIFRTPEIVLATIDRCAVIGEAVATKLGLRLMLFSASTLAQVEGVTHHSAFAAEKVGTPSVAEAAALAALGRGAKLSRPRRPGNGCTCAVAVLP